MSVKTEANDVTQLLINWREGDENAPAQLRPLVYEEVRQLTHNYLQRNRTDDTLQVTAPVREAYAHMVDDSQITGRDRAHFYEMAAREMRRVLVEHACCRARKNGNAGVNLVALDDALESFAQT